MLFLDEPSAGLDPQTRLLLWEIVRDYNRLGKTIVLTTHYMDEADTLCERLAIIDHGRIIALGTPAELKASIPGGYLLRLRFDRVTEKLLGELEIARRQASALTEPSGRQCLRRPRRPVDRPIGLTRRRPPEPELRDVHISEPSLENLFLHHTGRSLRD